MKGFPRKVRCRFYVRRVLGSALLLSLALPGLIAQSGSLDPIPEDGLLSRMHTLWRAQLAPSPLPLQTLAPGTTTLQANDAFWDDRFALAGVDGYVNAVAADGTTLYIGGSFASAGGLTVSNLVKWENGVWSDVGGGVDGTVYALAVDSNGDLFVGGQFTTAGATSVNHIAKWNGTSWTDLGGGMAGGGSNTGVYALKADGTTIYAGGYFATAGGTNATCIAQWSGGSWSKLGGTGVDGLPSVVYALELDGSGNVYAGGHFTTAGGLTVNHIALYDGSTWSALGNGTDGPVFTLARTGDRLYVGGRFTSAGNRQEDNLARYKLDTQSWASAASSGGPDGDVYALTVISGDLYVGGRFTQLGSTNATNAGLLTGGAWQALETGVTGDTDLAGIFALTILDGNVTAGGSFSQADGVHASRVATWAPASSTWTALSTAESQGADGPIRAMDALNGSLYAGGYFTSVGGVPARRIAQWNGTDWSSLGTGIQTGSVLAIAATPSGVYAGGTFDVAGGLDVGRIAFWNSNSSTWEALGDGIGGIDFAVVYAIAVSGNDVYVGGNFSTAGSEIVNGIAKWNAATQRWSALGSGVSGGSVLAIAINGNNVYIGGSFDQVDGQPAAHIARWNGNTWSSMPDMNGDIHVLTFDGNQLYAGGSFTSAGGQTANRVAVWNGNSWNNLDNGFNGDAVSTLQVTAGNVYAGGSFSGGTTDYIAHWDGNQWNSLGSGTDGSVRAMALIDDNLYVGGYFRNAGQKSSSFVGRWSSSSSVVQTCGLQTGWNIVSSYIDPVDNDIEAVLEGIEDDISLVKDNAGGLYWPLLNLNDLGTWSYLEAYRIYMTRASSLTLAGTRVAPTTSIALPLEWSLIPYFLSEPLPITTALNSIDGDYTLVKNNAGELYWPGLSITEFTVLEPCQGYQIFMNVASTLTYPASANASKQVATTSSMRPSAQHYLRPRRLTGSTAHLILPVEGLSDGDEIGVWTSDQLTGSGVVHEGRALVLLWGDNVATSELEGARDGDPLRLTHWSATTQTEATLDLDLLTNVLTGERTPGHQFRFTTDGVWTVETAGDGDVPRAFLLDQNYPNPFNPSTQLRYGVPYQAHVRLEVFNLLGQRVALLVDEVQPEGYHNVAFDGRHLPSGAYLYRLQAGATVLTKQMMVLK